MIVHLYVKGQLRTELLVGIRVHHGYELLQPACRAFARSSGQVPMDA